MMLTQAARRAQGQAAEDRFRAWLDRCRLPHIYGKHPAKATGVAGRARAAAR